MIDHELTPEQFQKLFSMSEDDYRNQAPEWLQRVPPVAEATSDGDDVQDLLDQLRTLTKRNNSLEQVLVSHEIPLPTDISYSEAKQKVPELLKLIADCADPYECQKLALELDKYVAALTTSEEYQMEQRQKELQWESDHASDNEAALRAVRRHMPVNVRVCSEATLCEDYGLSKALARKFVRTNILLLLRRSHSDMEKMHPSLLEGLKTTGLTLTERRALYCHLRPLGDTWTKAKDPMTKRKLTWYNMLKSKFQESLSEWEKHKSGFGMPSRTHECHLVGNQCPYRADAVIDYYSSSGSNFPEGDVYEVTEAAVASPSTPLPSSPQSLPLSQISPRAIQFTPDSTSKMEPNLPILSGPDAPEMRSATNKPESIIRESPQLVIPNKRSQEKFRDTRSVPASPPMGDLLAGMKNLKLRKTDGPKIKASLLKEVAPESRPTITPTVVPRELQVSPEVQPEPLSWQERRPPDKAKEVLPEIEARYPALRVHYEKAKRMDQLEAARVSCESLDDAMDQLERDMHIYIFWQLLDNDDLLSDAEKDQQIEAFQKTLQALEATVIQLYRRVCSGTSDGLSLFEIELAEDFYIMVSSIIVFILTRGKELRRKEKSIRDVIIAINTKLQDIHSSNDVALKKLCVKAKATRELRTVAEMTEKKKDQLSLQERSEARAAGLQRHYAKSTLTDAAVFCDRLDATMERFDSFLDEWVDQMMMSDDSDLADTEKQELLSHYRAALEELKIPVDELVERAASHSLSLKECELAEDLHLLSSCVFNFILQRMKKLQVKDKAIKTLLRELNDDIKAVRVTNLETLKELDVQAQPTRKVRSVKQIIEARIKEKKKVKPVETVAEYSKLDEILVSPSAPGPEQLPELSPRSPTVAPPVSHPPIVSDHESEPMDSDQESDSKLPVVVGREQLKWQLIRQVEYAARMKDNLEHAITDNGLIIPDDVISYRDAEIKMAEISRKMLEIGHKHAEYYKLEQEMEKYQSALLASDDYRQEIRRREREWEDLVAAENQKALIQLRRHMPVDIRNISETELSLMTTPNGKQLPPMIVKKFKRTNALQLIRLSPDYIEHVHFANLESVSLAGLTLTENRALYEHIRELGPKWEKGRKDTSIERKYMWFQLVRSKLKQALEQPKIHTKEVISYDDDYGFPAGPVYELLEVTKEDMDKYTRKNDDWD